MLRVYPNALLPEEVLYENDFLVSSNTQYRASVTSQGNLAIQRVSDLAWIWGTYADPNTPNGHHRMRMKSDCNFVLENRDTGNSVTWQSFTDEYNFPLQCYLTLHDDGLLTVNAGAPGATPAIIWSSGYGLASTNAAEISTGQYLWQASYQPSELAIVKDTQTNVCPNSQSAWFHQRCALHWSNTATLTLTKTTWKTGCISQASTTDDQRIAYVAGPAPASGSFIMMRPNCEAIWYSTSGTVLGRSDTAGEGNNCKLVQLDVSSLSHSYPRAWLVLSSMSCLSPASYCLIVLCPSGLFCSSPRQRGRLLALGVGG
jgi:hypothetical protein